MAGLEPLNNDNLNTEKDSATGNLHILLVDDVPENRLLLQAMLKKTGYAITLCEDGQQAVDISKKESFDLILMDIQMPNIDGLEATKLIRSDSVNEMTPIIALTARDSIDDEMICIEAGCDDYVVKPIKKDMILRKIERVFVNKQQIQAAEQGQEIVSSFADDSDYKKTIDMFVNELPTRIQGMQDAFDEGNLEDLAVKIHSLKGLGSFAGFPIYTEKAKVMEKTLQANDVENVKKQIQELADLCHKTKQAQI